MTGVCVWHENFHLKYASWNEYYITRNGLYHLMPSTGKSKNALAVTLELWRTVLHLLFCTAMILQIRITRYTVDFLAWTGNGC